MEVDGVEEINQINNSLQEKTKQLEIKYITIRKSSLIFYKIRKSL